MQDSELFDWIPKAITWELTYNDHKTSYESAYDYWPYSDECGQIDWADKDVCLEKDSVYVLRWYPDTPVGFCCVAASSLEKLAKYVRENAE